jgi:hypothetical protein
MTNVERPIPEEWWRKLATHSPDLATLEEDDIQRARAAVSSLQEDMDELVSPE